MIHRRWSEVGDTPSLWAGLKHCHVDLISSKSSSDLTSSQFAPPCKKDLTSFRSPKLSFSDSPCHKLHQTLSSKKLEFLEHLRLGCSGKDCIEILRMITRDHPRIRKVSLEMVWVDFYYKEERQLENAQMNLKVDTTNCVFFANGIQMDIKWVKLS